MSNKRRQFKNKKVRKDRRGPLERRIRKSEHATQAEAVKHSVLDCQDPAVLEHVETFIQSLRQGIKMDPIDLTSVESAQQSKEKIDSKLEFLQQKLKVARSLKRLLEGQKSDF